MSHRIKKFSNGIIVLEPLLFEDERGMFVELSKISALRALGIKQRLFQSNLSVSAQGVLRGMHCQKFPRAQAKLVTCIYGAIWDVVVDIRPQSKTYLQWYSFYLTAKSYRQLWIPEGFLHGFYSLFPQTVVVYYSTQEYYPEYDVTIAHNSPIWQIPWPHKKILSAKDAHAPFYHSSLFDNIL